MYKVFLISLWGFLFILCSETQANESVQTVYATVCEAIRENEPKSSARVRATDKASFKALENLSILSDYREKYDAHDYNVLIYSLVDNYLEDLAVRTTKQNDVELCVEVTGYLSPANIDAAAHELANKQKEKYPDSLDIEHAALTPPSPVALPPKPDIKISEDIAVEAVINEPSKEHEIINVPQLPQDYKTTVFIERTKFFNNTSTNAFHLDIKRIVEENKLNSVTTSVSNSDYIIKTKVLRAKVDPLNKQTNRMQMVVAIELVNTKDSTSIVEHQNRFILFESSENEQNVAASLLKKLLRKATKQIVMKIKNKHPASNSIITPTTAISANN